MLVILLCKLSARSVETQHRPIYEDHNTTPVSLATSIGYWPDQTVCDK